MDIAKNIEKFKKEELPEGVELVAVSKTKPNEDIMEAYNTGHLAFGENRVQELVTKYEELPKDIQWHMIGHLQSNKVKYIVPFVYLIHSVDKPKLLKVINKEAQKNNRIIDVLLQFHIAEEETKYGFDFDEVQQLLESKQFNEYVNVNVRGVMGMATFTDDMEKVRREFKHLADIFGKLKQNYFSDKQDFNEISMGMTNDYRVALEEGATILRIGSLIFGKRNNH
ncbi:MAG: YggS family pyridoxal phosphate-dependent enzyme [Bacteroidales bacterium]